MALNPNGPQMMTTMRDFIILSKIGNYDPTLVQEILIESLLHRRWCLQ